MSTRFRTPLSLVALGASFLIAEPVMAAQPSGPKLVPFHAIYSGGYRAQVVPPNVIITGTGGQGHGSHLGRFELTNRISVSLIRTPLVGCAVLGTNEIYTATLTAADGDTITLEGTGRGCQTSPTTVAVVDQVTIMGGTGRFEGATGSLVVNSAVDQAAADVVISFDGEISSVGSIK